LIELWAITDRILDESLTLFKKEMTNARTVKKESDERIEAQNV
jgi:hypothetical protein